MEPTASPPPPRLTSWEKALPRKGVVVFLGDRDGGKSALAWWLLTGLHERAGLPVVAYGIPRAAQGFFPDWVTHVTGDISRLRNYREHAVLVDEAAIRAPARRFQSDDNLQFGRLVAISRQAHQLLFFITQHTRQIDLLIIGDANRVLYKMPSILHVRFARPELRPEVQRARELLLARKEPRKWTYVFDYQSGAEGLLTNSLPGWWTEQASEAFSLAEAGELAPPPSGNHRRGENALQALRR